MGESARRWSRPRAPVTRVRADKRASLLRGDGNGTVILRNNDGRLKVLVGQWYTSLDSKVVLNRSVGDPPISGNLAISNRRGIPLGT